jgi:CBS domain containing-hemolysin-like protein
MIAGFWPLKWTAQLLIRITNLILPGKGLKEGPFISEQEFLGMVEEAHSHAVIEEEEREMIESVMGLGDTTTAKIMVPAPDIVAVRDDMDVTEALDLAVKHHLSRIPVLLDDGSAGVLLTKDLIFLERGGRGMDRIRSHMKSIEIVPETMITANLMRRMQEKKFHIALVADEYGTISGLVTLEDCLEELVGEIIDEHDHEELPALDTRGGVLRTGGATGIDDLNEALRDAGIDHPILDPEHSSIGGVVFSALGREPRNGDVVMVDGWRIIVESMEGRRVRKLRLERENP